MEDWQNWTPCEMYGHQYSEDGYCSCGEQSIEEDPIREVRDDTV